MGTGQQLIVAALQDEIRELKSKLVVDCTIHLKPATLHRGLIFNREVELLVTGIGLKNMEKGLCAALENQTPKSILHVGYAGSTSPLASLGALILAQKVVSQKTGRVFESDPGLLRQAQKICSEKKWSCKTGAMVTVEEIISSPHQKADLGAVHDCLGVDMEAAALAEVASEKKIPWLVVKSVLDPMEMILPDLQDCVEPDGESSPFLVMEHLFKKPQDLMKLPQLQYCATQARHSLTDFVEAWIRQDS